MKVILPCMLLAMSLVGCASTGPQKDYVYIPNQISDPLKGNMNKLADELSKEQNLVAEFVEEQTLLKIEIRAGRDSRFAWGVPRNDLYEQLCFSDDGFYKAIREAGIGVEYTLIDESSKQEFGPWNAAACL
ncbi:hypothetical protein [Vibrio sp. 99-70-13A1]|uniref:hypothetical protein n=1 Tax=Vibrio sp. 99-70-13A1 TaxID=2607601 RepID=UPI0014937E60|nr:hypothetical protein [Vibrio sp. 99-70-13A1]NOH97539.1 hypothetical protein [Vibrio sp. 99-70-13A1]